jgi:alpha-beta hydrolase superfamily lysophospholipase
MNPAQTIVAVLGIVVWPLLLAAVARAQEIVTLPTRPGVTQSYFLAGVPNNPHAVALLFPGAGGFIRLRREEKTIKFDSDSFLMRSQTEFTKRGVVGAVMDAPSDQQSGRGMSDEFRLGADHFRDIAAVIGDLKKKLSEKPLFLIGTSRGSTSAAALGARFGHEVSGAVLTATMFRQTGRQSKEPGPGLSRFEFGTIKIPVLLVHHVGDQCNSTPYSGAARLSVEYPLITVAGGSPPQSGPCDPLSAHGFLGKESETVEQIVNWMLKKPFQREVK